MVAADADGVEFGHVFGAALEDVGNDFHGGQRGIYIGVANHEFFEDVVLDGATEFFHGDALLFGSNDIECQYGQYGAIHGHGNGHFVEGDVVEEYLHIEDRIYGNTCFSDIADDAFVVGVVAAMGSQIESDGQSFLPCRQIATIESIGFFGGGEACILANSPRLHDIHGGVRSTQKWREPCGIVEMFHAREVVVGVNGFQGNLLRCEQRDCN